MRSVLEALMYVAFFAAALPFAWLDVHEVLYYQAHPERLSSRDSALLVFAAMTAIRIMTPALGVAVLLALYFLVSGPRAARVSAAVLVVAWLLRFSFAYWRTPPPFASMARIYWEAVPSTVLSLLPWICAGVRLARRSRD